MSFLRSRFVQAVLVLVVAFVILRFGIRPPAPWSVFTLYMAIVLLAVLIYVSSDGDAWREFKRPVWSTLVDPDKRASFDPTTGYLYVNVNEVGAVAAMKPSSAPT